MREEFQQRRGYDLWSFLPVFTGRVVDSLELSERFLWDLRQTVSDLIVENYAGQFRKLANQRGLRLSIEAYGEPADDMTYAGQADEPMSEFWSWAQVWCGGELHGDGLRGAHVRETHSRCRSIYRYRCRKMVGAPGQHQGSW